MAFPYDMWPPEGFTQWLMMDFRTEITLVVLAVACMMLAAGLYYAAAATWSAAGEWLRRFLDHLPAHDEPGRP